MSFFAPRSLIIWPFASSTILLSEDGYSITVLFSMLSNLVKTFYLLSSIIKNKISSPKNPLFFLRRGKLLVIVTIIIVIIFTLSVVIFLIMCVFIPVLNICYLVDFSPIQPYTFTYWTVINIDFVLLY
jgi:hypothetical protein